MKKQKSAQRRIDVRIGYLARTGSSTRKRKTHTFAKFSANDEIRSQFFERNDDLLQVEIDERGRVEIRLPRKMNFSTEYEATVAHLMAIRTLVKRASNGKSRLRLKRVAFEELKEISTSAALVLTAELAKWEDASKIGLRPNVEQWDDEIFREFSELGFFDLFKNPPEKEIISPTSLESGRHLVKYIKGKFKEHDKPRQLQTELRGIVGNEIDEWQFLHSGLMEAIVNVTHHAYPKELGLGDKDKNWYLTGSYDKSTRQLKIVFYDQGISIPKSLPASDWGEKILKYLSSKKLLEGINDSNLIAAAMEMSRSRTNDADRGKGLQDILEFVKQRNQGYLAVVSGKGSFRLEVTGTSEKPNTHGLREPLQGTLIVWSVKLENAGYKHENY